MFVLHPPVPHALPEMHPNDAFSHPALPLSNPSAPSTESPDQFRGSFTGGRSEPERQAQTRSDSQCVWPHEHPWVGRLVEGPQASPSSPTQEENSIFTPGADLELLVAAGRRVGTLQRTMAAEVACPQGCGLRFPPAAGCRPHPRRSLPFSLEPPVPWPCLPARGRAARLAKSCAGRTL